MFSFSHFQRNVDNACQIGDNSTLALKLVPLGKEDKENDQQADIALSFDNGFFRSNNGKVNTQGLTWT